MSKDKLTYRFEGDERLSNRRVQNEAKNASETKVAGRKICDVTESK